MTPGAMPLTLYRGDSARWRFTLWTDAEKTAPADLTGVVAAAEIRGSPGGTLIAPIALSITLPNIIDGVLAAADSAKLPASGAAWDLQLTYPSGDVATILAGAVKVRIDVTAPEPLG